MVGEQIEWPYPIRYGEEKEVNSDVLVLGGGIAGCFAATSAAKKGLKVVIVEKAATIRSGAGGAGCDHWNYTPNPCSKITSEEILKENITSGGGYTNAISRYITCREGYDTLLELENMGGKIRDTEDEFKGAEFRDEKTKFLFAYDYVNKLHFRIWGTTFKPVLYKECKRLGVTIFDRTQATSLLTEGSRQGARVIGATGLNVRTGEFIIFKAKATVICLSRPQRVWQFQSELTGLNNYTAMPQTCVGNGHAMIWRTGGELTLMERSERSIRGIGNTTPQYGTGHASTTWYACSMVDANGKEIPWVDVDGKILKKVSERYHPTPKQKYIGESSTLYEYRQPRLIPDLEERIRKGEFILPLYANLPSMPKMERKVIWGMMVGEEGKTKIPILQNYTEAGFDPNKDLLQSYMMLGGDLYSESGTPQQRQFRGGGPVVDWDLKTTLDGVYAAGDQLFNGVGLPHAAATGRYAGRKAADYALKAAEPIVERSQIEAEKVRIYAPIKRKKGIEWKELNASICRVMQNYCGDPKNGELLSIGLTWLKDIEENETSHAYATDPHKLGRTIDVLDILTVSQSIIYVCLARRASSKYLGFNRLDYPEIDPPEWRKFLTIKLEDGEIKHGELSISFWGNITENYKAHNKDYKGWVL